jgi:hypothetical protein
LASLIGFYVYSLKIQLTELINNRDMTLNLFFFFLILFSIWELQNVLDQEPYLEFGGTKKPFGAVAFKIQ